MVSCIHCWILWAPECSQKSAESALIERILITIIKIYEYWGCFLFRQLIPDWSIGFGWNINAELISLIIFLSGIHSVMEIWVLSDQRFILSSLPWIFSLGISTIYRRWSNEFRIITLDLRTLFLMQGYLTDSRIFQNFNHKFQIHSEYNLKFSLHEWVISFIFKIICCFNGKGTYSLCKKLVFSHFQTFLLQLMYFVCIAIK